VSDRFDDISEFRKDFPALHDASIEREVLPAWEEDRSSRAAAAKIRQAANHAKRWSITPEVTGWRTRVSRIGSTDTFTIPLGGVLISCIT